MQRSAILIAILTLVGCHPSSPDDLEPSRTASAPVVPVEPLGPVTPAKPVHGMPPAEIPEPTGPSLRLSRVADGFAGSSVNAVVFRKNSIVTHGERQFVAFYDEFSRVVLAARTLGGDAWQVQPTRYVGDTSDAHNSISLMVDGEGYLHVAWNHHADPLSYARGIEPGGLELGEPEPMLGVNEGRVTYPEFHTLPEGDLLFVYRDGRSGDGSMVLNRYRLAERRWERVQSNLLDGEGERNAYWQLFVTDAGTLHVSWVWRESADVASNHDIGHALSRDGGLTWESVDGARHALPLTASSVPPIRAVPEGSNLINQTSMTVDGRGRPCIATYFRDGEDDVTQIRVIRHDGERWRDSPVSERTAGFDLSGGGTRSLPLSRPQILSARSTGATTLHVLYRDAEAGDRAILASTTIEDDGEGALDWTRTPVTTFSTGRWEPTFDTELWRTSGRLHVFVQDVGQVDGDDGTSLALPPTPVQVLEIEF